jgi:hypothetical protein
MERDTWETFGKQSLGRPRQEWKRTLKRFEVFTAVTMTNAVFLDVAQAFFNIKNSSMQKIH